MAEEDEEEKARRKNFRGMQYLGLMTIFRSVSTNNKPGMIGSYDVLWYVQATNKNRMEGIGRLSMVFSVGQSNVLPLRPRNFALFAVEDVRRCVRERPQPVRFKLRNY